MYPILFHLGRLNFYTHGLTIALGALLAGGTIFYLAGKKKLPRKFLFDLLVYSLFGGIVGARLVYVLIYYYQFPNWYEMFYIWYGGLVSFGGIFFGFLTAYFILKRYRQNVFQWFDLGIIGLFLGWAVGRVGCFLTGDIPGVSSSSWLAIWGQIPVSLLESFWSLILAAILLYLTLWRKELLDKWQPGVLFFGGLAGYSLGRLVIDFWRDERVFYFLRGGQIASLIILIVSVAIIIYFFRKIKKE